MDSATNKSARKSPGTGSAFFVELDVTMVDRRIESLCS